MKIKRTHLRSLTLIEMLVSIGIVTLVMGAVVVALQQALSVFKINSVKAELAKQAASTAEWLVRDIRDSACIFQVNNTSLVLNTASDGYVKYKFENNTLSRALLKACANTVFSPVSINIAAGSFKFSYYNETNQLITDIANNTGNIKAIGINLTTEKEGRTFNLNTLGAFGFPVSKCVWSKNYKIDEYISEFHYLRESFDTNGKLDGFIFAGTENSTGNKNFFAVKTDTLGNVGPTYNGTWSNVYGGATYDNLYKVNQDSDGGYVMGGTTTSFGLPDENCLVIKVDSLGNREWARTYGGSGGHDRLQWMAPDHNGGYILAGQTSSQTGEAPPGISGGNCAFLAKIGLSGNNVDWVRAYGGVDGTTTDLIHAKQTNDHGYILGAYTTAFGVLGYDMLLIKTDSTGIMQWNRTYSMPETGKESLQYIDQTFDGGYIFGGYTTTINAYDWLVIKTNETGFPLWNKTYGGDGEDRLYSLQQTSDGGYIFGGYSQSSELTAYGRDFLAIKTNSTGDISWAKVYNIKTHDILWAIRQTPDGSYIMCGEADGGVDPVVIKADINGEVDGCTVARDVTNLIQVSNPAIVFNATPGVLTTSNFGGTFGTINQTANLTVASFPVNSTGNVCPPSCP